MNLIHLVSLFLLIIFPNLTYSGKYWFKIFVLVYPDFPNSTKFNQIVEAMLWKKQFINVNVYLVFMEILTLTVTKVFCVLAWQDFSNSIYDFFQTVAAVILVQQDKHVRVMVNVIVNQITLVWSVMNVDLVISNIQNAEVSIYQIQGCYSPFFLRMMWEKRWQQKFTFFCPHEYLLLLFRP